jgi:hypothetical protein
MEGFDMCFSIISFLHYNYSLFLKRQGIYEKDTSPAQAQISRPVELLNHL